MPDKSGNPIPGEPTHWRYEKDKEAAKSVGVTSTETVKKEKSEAESTVFSKTAVKDMKREQQESILSDRKVEFSSKDKEVDLVKKILKSNPK